MPQRPSAIHFIGSGPGDPELITVKGMKLLKKADLVVYTGSLVQEKVLKYCKKGAAIKNSASMELKEITSVMAKAARAGKTVVRLHTGDPSLYSAMREQAAELEKYGIPYDVVPGVSSAFGAAASIKKELTMPEVTQTVIFTRLEGRTPVPKKEKLSLLAKHNATICVFLSVSMIEKVVSELLKGYKKTTPVAVVYRATWQDEHIVTGTLKDIAGKVKEAGISKHAMIIAGRAVGGALKKEARSKLYDSAFSHSFRII